MALSTTSYLVPLLFEGIKQLLMFSGALGMPSSRPVALPLSRQPYLEPPFLRGPSGLITDSSCPRPSLSCLSGERCCWRLSESGELSALALGREAGGLPLPPPPPLPGPPFAGALRLRHSSTASSPMHSAMAPAEAQNQAPPPRLSRLPVPGAACRAAGRPPSAPAEAALGVVLGWVAAAALPVGGGGGGVLVALKPLAVAESVGRLLLLLALLLLPLLLPHLLPLLALLLLGLLVPATLLLAWLLLVLLVLPLLLPL